jgi:two-component system NtrC family sensor kinase
MNPVRLLLVDDELNIIRALRRLFFDDDYQVHSASSGEEGLKILESTEVDLIIADYRMTGMNGIEFFRHARKLQPDALRIILSGYAEIHLLTDAINEGNIYRFIFKPWNDDELKRTIQLAFERQRLMQENRHLTGELQRKNEQLHDFNRQLEQQVQRRTQELLVQNQVLSVSQEILELVPVGVVGFSGDGLVVVMNHAARSHFKGGAGKSLEDVLPEDLAARCSQLLQNPSAARQFEAVIKDRGYTVEFHPLIRADKVHGGVLIYYQPESAADSSPVLAPLQTEPTLN